jgi:curli biogenesis system outer membrane secretion channel CsgG/uncharacterized protein YcfL
LKEIVMTKVSHVCLAILSGVLLWGGSSAQAQEKAKKKDTIFIGQLKIRSSVEDAAAKDPQLKIDLARAKDVMEAQMPVVVGRIGVFDLLERDRLKELLDEEKLKELQNGSIGILQKTGATYAFFPEVDTFVFGEDRAGAHIEGVGRRNDVRLKMLIHASVRIVDVATGKVLPDQISVQWPKRGAPDYNVLDGEKVDFDVGRQQMLVDMSEQLARVAVIQTIGSIRPAKVLTVNDSNGGREAMINRGETADFKQGAAVKLYATQVVEDPDSGEKILNEVYAGKGIVDRPEARKCFIKILEEQKEVPISPGCVAKLDEVVPEALPPKPIPVPPVSEGEKPPAPPVTNSSTGGVVPDATAWVNDLAQPGKVKFVTDKLKKNIAVTAVKPVLTPAKFLKVSTELTSTEEMTVTGTYKWFDANGAPVAPGDARPKTIFLRGKVPATIDGTAPDTGVKSFELVIEPQGK